MKVQGRVEPGFEPVRDAFADMLAAQPGTGAAVAAWVDGAWVADLWGGRAELSGRPWRATTIVQPYSVTKPFVAVCALKLVEEGLLDLDASIQRYWPEFRAPATVRQVLCNQAGIVALSADAPTEVFCSWDDLCALLAAEEPAWEPGTAHGESPLFYGHLVGELIRRVSGKTPGQYLRDEVALPHSLDFAIGLDAMRQARAVELTGLDDDFRTQNAAGRPELYRRAIENPPGALDGAVVNSPAWRSAEIPAVNGHGTARSVAGLYVGLLTGGLFGAGLLDEATTAQLEGPDLVFGPDQAWGLGFAVDPTGFGMGGLGGSLGWASRTDRYAFGFVTGSMGGGERAEVLENALRSCVGLAPLAD